MSIDKQSALARLAAIEEEAKKLREIITAPEVVSLLPTPAALKGAYFGFLESGGSLLANPVAAASAAGPVQFEDFDTASKYAKAIATLIQLRQQPGTVPPTDRPQHQIVTDKGIYDGSTAPLRVLTIVQKGIKLSSLSPCFATAGDAMAAINAVGVQDIERMFLTLHGLPPKAE